jgi:hypothetical protein
MNADDRRTLILSAVMSRLRARPSGSHGERPTVTSASVMPWTGHLCFLPYAHLYLSAHLKPCANIAEGSGARTWRTHVTPLS